MLHDKDRVSIKGNRYLDTVLTILDCCQVRSSWELLCHNGAHCTMLQGQELWEAQPGSGSGSGSALVLIIFFLTVLQISFRLRDMDSG